MKLCDSAHKDVSEIGVGETYIENGIEYVLLRRRVCDGITIISTERKVDPEQRAISMRKIRRNVEDYLRANTLKIN